MSIYLKEVLQNHYETTSISTLFYMYLNYFVKFEKMFMQQHDH